MAEDRPLSRKHWWQADHVPFGDEMIDVRWWDRFITHRLIRPVWLWWGYHVRRFPKPPPFDQDPVARHFGFVDGVPACVGPICQEHEWKVVDHA